MSGWADLLADAFRVDDLVKHMDEVIELAVDVTNYNHWLGHLQEIGLLL